MPRHKRHKQDAQAPCPVPARTHTYKSCRYVRQVHADTTVSSRAPRLQNPPAVAHLYLGKGTGRRERFGHRVLLVAHSARHVSIPSREPCCRCITSSLPLHRPSKLALYRRHAKQERDASALRAQASHRRAARFLCAGVQRRAASQPPASPCSRSAQKIRCRMTRRGRGRRPGHLRRDEQVDMRALGVYPQTRVAPHPRL